jgi:hypothetical protein
MDGAIFFIKPPGKSLLPRRHEDTKKVKTVFKFLQELPWFSPKQFYPNESVKSSRCKAHQERGARLTTGTLSVSRRRATPQVDFLRVRPFQTGGEEPVHPVPVWPAPETSPVGEKPGKFRVCFS